MDKLFEVAAKVSNQWSLAAFAIAAIVAILLRLSGKRVPKIGWALVIAIVILAVVPIVAPAWLDNFGLYRVRIIVTRQGSPVDQAEVKCSLGGEVLKTSAGWECDIPAKSRPSAGQLTVFATDRTAFLQASQSIHLGGDYAPAVELPLQPDASAILHGSVIDDSSHAPIAGALVHVVGYDNESVVTGRTGDFTLKTHAAEGQQVKIAAVCEGYQPFLDWSMASSLPAEIRLVRQAHFKPRATAN